MEIVAMFLLALVTVIGIKLLTIKPSPKGKLPPLLVGAIRFDDGSTEKVIAALEPERNAQGLNVYNCTLPPRMKLRQVSGASWDVI